MDISETLAPTSDQLDAIELVAGPRTFQVESVSAGNPEQPVQVKLVGFPRVWRPSKGMRRVLAAGWGVDASAWTGRKLTLFYDPNVMFGKDKTGGTRISHMTDLPGNRPLSVPLLISRGKSAMFVVKPLADEPAPTKPAAKSTSTRTDEALTAFAGIGVTEQQLMDRIGRPADKWTAADIGALGAVFVSIRSGKTTAEQEFTQSEPQLPNGADQ